MLLHRYYGSMVMEFPAASVVGMARAAAEQELRDELRPIWLVRLIADKITGQETPSFEDLLHSLTTEKADPSADTIAELESVVKRYQEVHDGVDLPAVR